MKVVPRIKALLERLDIRSTFFTTSKACETFPECIEALAERHELGVHSRNHERLTELSKEELERVLAESTKEVKRYYPVKGFRAPYFQINNEALFIISELGYMYDSSVASYKPWSGIEVKGIREVPCTYPNDIFRFPNRIIVKLLRRRENSVVFIHPWEFIDLPKVPRIDCWIGTGEWLFKKFDKLLTDLKKQDFEFKTVAEFIHA